MRKPYPMAKFDNILLNLEGFQYAKSLHLNMGYYHIWISEDASNLWTIFLPWIKYHYKRLPIGVSDSPKIFQQKMNNVFLVFESIHVYMDNRLILPKGYWIDHVQKMIMIKQNIFLLIIMKKQQNIIIHNKLELNLSNWRKFDLKFSLWTNQNWIFSFPGNTWWRKTNKNISAIKYDTTDCLKGSSQVDMFSKLPLWYVDKKLTYISTFN